MILPINIVHSIESLGTSMIQYIYTILDTIIIDCNLLLDIYNNNVIPLEYVPYTNPLIIFKYLKSRQNIIKTSNDIIFMQKVFSEILLVCIYILNIKESSWNHYQMSFLKWRQKEPQAVVYTLLMNLYK